MKYEDIEQPFVVLSAHDDTVFSFLAAIGAADTAHLPNFVAHVAVELRVADVDSEDAEMEEDEAGVRPSSDRPLCPDYKFYVKILYDDKAVAKVMGDTCGSEGCEFEEWKSRL